MRAAFQITCSSIESFTLACEINEAGLIFLLSHCKRYKYPKACIKEHISNLRSQVEQTINDKRINTFESNDKKTIDTAQWLHRDTMFYRSKNTGK